MVQPQNVFQTFNGTFSKLRIKHRFFNYSQIKGYHYESNGDDKNAWNAQLERECAQVTTSRSS